VSLRPEFLPESAGCRNLLVDSNLLVLYVVGAVNRRRIAQFKRTEKYNPADYELLTMLMSEFTSLYTVPQVMADLVGRERIFAREVLKRMICEVTESAVSSRDASDHQIFANLGLTDAAIASAARGHDCFVLTDDLPLYVWLNQVGVPAANYTHLRERFGTL